jgi:hypothetical protein
MKKIIVCGDSYMSPVLTKEYVGTHFSEIIAKELGFELIAYSRGGMSNGGICIQIKTAIEAKPDLILLGTTYHDRLEWPYNEIRPIDNLSINDIFYNHPVSLSVSYPWLNKDPKLVSTALRDIFDHWDNQLHSTAGDKYSKERLDALQKYFEFLYHPNLKKFIDETMIYAMYHQLHKSNIPYIICSEQLKGVVNKCEWLNFGNNSFNYARPDFDQIQYDLCYGSNHIDPGYHSKPEAQAKIAKLLLEKYIPNIL